MVWFSQASGELVSSAAGLGSGLWRIAPAIVRVIVVINLNNIGFCELANARVFFLIARGALIVLLVSARCVPLSLVMPR